MSGGIRVRLWLIFTILILGLVTALGSYVSRDTTAELERTIRAQLHARGTALAGLLARRAAVRLGMGADISGDVEPFMEEVGVLFVVVQDEDGRTVVERAPNFGRPRLTGLLQAAAREPDGIHEPEEDDLFVARVEAVREVTSSSADMDDVFGELAPSEPAPTETATSGFVYVALSTQAMQADLREAKGRARVSTLAFGLLAAALALSVTLWVTRPLGRMVEAAERMARGEYESVSPIKARFIEVKEVGLLADSFAVMRESLAKLADQARRIAEGDLTRRVDGAGRLGDAFNAMVASLSSLVGQIKEASLQIASSGSEILAASKQAEKGSAEQASSISQTTTTMDELLSASKQIATSADDVVQIAERTLSAAKGGEEAVGESLKGMEEIADNNRQTAERTLELSERNQEIGNVVDLIDEIADKSDLLALNAAIEGAKAGEAGKGFSVVATEMRALAENVIASTKEIKGLISQIQKASNASVLATEGQMKATERGTHVAEKTAEHLQQILLMAEQTTEAAKQISLATQQQRTGTEQVVQSMSEIAKIAKSNVAGATQTTSSAVELASLADELRQAVSRFRLGAGD